MAEVWHANPIRMEVTFRIITEGGTYSQSKPHEQLRPDFDERTQRDQQTLDSDERSIFAKRT